MNTIPHLVLAVDGPRSPDGEPFDDFPHHARLACDAPTVRELLGLMRQVETAGFPAASLVATVFRDRAEPDFYDLPYEDETIPPPISTLGSESFLWMLPDTAYGVKNANTTGVRLHVAPDVIWWTAIPSSWGIGELLTAEVPRAELLRALLWTVSDEELPAVIGEIREKEPSLLLDIVERKLALLGGDGARHPLQRDLPLIPPQWLAPLLSADDGLLRQRAIMALGGARPDDNACLRSR